ncbi:Choline-sulfatase [Pirellulimonas nuda]|uniref:Choline-sulfatase n=1 Tax=Pirellulimonas nuda TaxID=2528009 RepID=A0A518DI74_9BACT|nr:sulfatase [Pirellulimonas nuda]QDU91164.1 Choline-sulfatase [Pirellulimonas nuda]
MRLSLFLLAVLAPAVTGAATQRPNVLMIAVDDLNDWVGALGGHPQARTPAMDALARRATVFTNAHCAAPICNPSRAALFTGRLPSSTGIYHLAPLLRGCASTRHALTLPQYFALQGYRTLAAGKLLHTADGSEFQTYAGTFGGFGPAPESPISFGVSHPLWDWGAMEVAEGRMPDERIAAWTAQQLEELPHDRPFFLACGFYKPHVPMIVPQRWFDLHPLEEVLLPPHRRDDLRDVPGIGLDLSYSAVAPRHEWMVENRQWRHAVQSYLACTSFVDAQVGKVLAALEASPHADNTVVVLWSDHGFHLGDKECWGKRSLWEATTKVVLMIDAPGTPPARCDRPVGLIDLYPTLCQLCQLPTVLGLDGHDLSPLLSDPKQDWPWPALTTFGQNNHTLRSDRWRYIEYQDGSRELYDHWADPHEFDNLADEPRYAGVVRELRRALPKTNVPMAPGSNHTDARPGSAVDID